MWVTMFSSKQGRKGRSAGHYGAPCQSVLLHASLPINLAMSAPNKQVTNDKWTAKCSSSISVSPFHLFLCSGAGNSQEVKGRRETDTQKPAPPPFLFQKISLGGICLNSTGAGAYKEREKQNEPREAVQRQLPLVCTCRPHSIEC